MLVLLDENLPHQFRLLIEGHEVRTAAYQGWAGLSNGALLNAAEQAGFDLMVTVDKNLTYQQNFDGRKLALIILSSKRIEAIKASLPSIMEAISKVGHGRFCFLDIGR